MDVVDVVGVVLLVGVVEVNAHHQESKEDKIKTTEAAVGGVIIRLIIEVEEVEDMEIVGEIETAMMVVGDALQEVAAVVQ